MVVLLHGANQYQNVNLVHFSTQGLVIPGAYDVPAAVIFPNGRTTGWGTALAEQDALDATDDAIARLDIDADRVVLSGISSGGIGTFRLASALARPVDGRLLDRRRRHHRAGEPDQRAVPRLQRPGRPAGERQDVAIERRRPRRRRDRRLPHRARAQPVARRPDRRGQLLLPRPASAARVR